MSGACAFGGIGAMVSSMEAVLCDVRHILVVKAGGGLPPAL
jgi:hypothetical protein